MTTLYNLIGIGRSGTHAIQLWILGHYEKNLCIDTRNYIKKGSINIEYIDNGSEVVNRTVSVKGFKDGTMVLK